MFSLKEVVAQPDQGFEEVEALTLEMLFSNLSIEHVDLMKLDVEGEEMEIIGGKAFDLVASKIDIIVGENHSWNATNPEQLKTALIDRGFNFEWIPSDAQLFVAKK